MAVLKRGAIPAPPALAREIVAVPSLGGDVIVVELMLEDRLEFDNALAAQRRGRGGVFAFIPQLLAMAVLVEDDPAKPPPAVAAAAPPAVDEPAEPPVEVPLYTAAQWRTWGARNRDAAVDLFNRAMKLSGLDADHNAKN